MSMCVNFHASEGTKCDAYSLDVKGRKVPVFEMESSVIGKDNEERNTSMDAGIYVFFKNMDQVREVVRVLSEFAESEGNSDGHQEDQGICETEPAQERP